MAEENSSDQSKAIIERLKAEGLLTRNTGTNSIKAVIDRLKAEGDLLRNTGSNSIKSVKIEIEKFRGIFQTIAHTTEQQTQMLTTSLRIAQEQREQQTREQDLREVAPGQDSEQVKELREKVTLATLKNDLQDQKDRAKQRSEGIGLFQIIKTLGQSLKKPLLWLLGGTASFFFLRGFFDELTGGGFTRLQKAVEEKIPLIVDAFAELAKKISDPEFIRTIGLIAAVAAPLAALASALPIITNMVQTAAILKMLNERAQQGPGGAPPIVVPTDESGTGRRRRRRRGNVGRNDPAFTRTEGPFVLTSGGIYAPDGARAPTQAQQNAAADQMTDAITDRRTRGQRAASLLRSANIGRNILLSSLGSSMIYFSQSGALAIEDEATNVDIDEVMNAPITNYSQSTTSGLSTIAGFATLGSMFGPKGAIAGAIVGSTYVLGKAVYEKINDSINDADVIANDVQVALEDAEMRARAGIDPLEAYSNLRDVSDKTIEQAKADIAANDAEIAKLQAEQRKDMAIRDEYGTNDTRGSDARARIQNRDARIRALFDKNKLRLKQIESTNDILAQTAVPVDFGAQMDRRAAQNAALESINSFAGRATSPIIVNSAPVVTPTVTNITTGGTSVLNNNLANIGGGGFGIGAGGVYRIPSSIN